MPSHDLWRSRSERMVQLEGELAALRQRNDELQAKYERLEQRVEHATEAEAILRRAQASPVPQLPRTPAHKRPNPAGLHIVHCAAVASGGVVAWVLRSKVHKVAALALMAAVAAAGSAAPTVVTGTPPAPVRSHHRVPALPPVPGRKRRRMSGSAAVPGASPAAAHRRPGASPSPGVTPAVTPVPLPAPLPSGTGSVSPLCVKLTDTACDHNPQCVCPADRDGDADDVLAAA